MKAFQKILALVLAVLILVSTNGITVEKFYCGSYLKSVHVFTSPKPCCPRPNTPEGSCRTETKYSKADINIELPPLVLKLVPLVISYFIYEVFILTTPAIAQSSIVKYLNYKPPLIPEDIPVLIQSFLI